jgi:MerR family transcriptional regulator, copper efflux regulator
VSNGLTRGELAKEAQVNAETVRFWEVEGLIPKPPRTPAGYRKFPAETVDRLRFIKRSQELGFTLKEIRELLNLRVKPGGSCADVRQRAEAKLLDVDARIRQLQRIRKALVEMTKRCSGQGPVDACTILQTLSNGKNR